MALLFYGHSYPNDFLPVVRAIMRELERRYNILPVAFSQNEDGDLEKLEEIVCQNISPVAAVINLMPFRLGAGPMGGDAKRAVEILERADVPYLKPFCLTKVTQDEWKNSAGVNPGEFMISILLPTLLLFGILMLFMRRMNKSGGGIMGVGKSRAKAYVQKETGITFKDVAGQDEAKESLQEVVDFLHNPQKYTQIGAKLPKGALLVGTSGNRKDYFFAVCSGRHVCKICIEEGKGTDYCCSIH